MVTHTHIIYIYILYPGYSYPVFCFLLVGRIFSFQLHAVPTFEDPSGDQVPPEFQMGSVSGEKYWQRMGSISDVCGIFFAIQLPKMMFFW